MPTNGNIARTLRLQEQWSRSIQDWVEELYAFLLTKDDDSEEHKRRLQQLQEAADNANQQAQKFAQMAEEWENL